MLVMMQIARSVMVNTARRALRPHKYHSCCILQLHAAHLSAMSCQKLMVQSCRQSHTTSGSADVMPERCMRQPLPRQKGALTAECTGRELAGLHQDVSACK
jgi:hypothetical protein